MLDCADEVIDAVRDSAGLVIQPAKKQAMDAVDQQIIEVQEAVLALHKAKQQHIISSEEYNQRVQEYSQQMRALQERQEQLRTAGIRYTEVKVWLDTFEEHIKSGDIMSTDDGTILKTLVEQIIVSGGGSLQLWSDN
jgi:prefoldin subunit 5